MFTPREEYLHVIKHTQLVSVDLIILDQENNVLLGLRENEPAKNTWFVPGGRIFKNENLKEALERVSQKELGLTLNQDNSKVELFGVYNHTYRNNFDNDDFGTKYIVFAHIIKVNKENIKLEYDEQHSSLRWFNIKDLLEDKQVHQFIKYYFSVCPENRIF